MGLRAYFFPVFRSYSAVLFNSSVFSGIVLLILTFLNPNVGFGGFVSVFSAYLFARLIGLKQEFLRLDYYIYNPLLVGLSLGYLFRVNSLSILLFAISGIVTFLLTYTLSSLFVRYLGLPVLSVPFVIVSSFFYLASSKFSNLFLDTLYPHLFTISDSELHMPSIIEGYFTSLGAIFFLPYPLEGLVIFFILLFVSRILLLLSILGFVCGVSVHALFIGSFSQALSDPSSFNYILTSMAVGGVFLLPSVRSYKFAVVSSVLSVPIVEGAKAFWESYSIPVFAFPFNLATHLMLYVLFSIGFKYAVQNYKGTPEKTLDYYLTVYRRFPFTGREISLPFSGRWTVWQSFDGEWTHKGAWRHAVDFVITDEKGKTYSGRGLTLTDYYAFGKPVLSPVDGHVVSVVSSVPDNPPGSVDREMNWGNYVVIKDDRGFYVLIAHLKRDSIRVKKGDYVAKGTLLGLCGNSGYSPQPHIHIQIQLSEKVGVPTVPFKFSSYVSDNTFFDVGLPMEGEKIEPVYPDKSVHRKLNFLLDSLHKYRMKSSKEDVFFELKVGMAADGTFFFTDGRARLYFGMKNSAFYFYHLDGDVSSPLRYFFFSSPKIPLVFKKNLAWKDFLPLQSVFSPLKRELFLFLSAFNHSLYSIEVESKWKEDSCILTTINMPSGRVNSLMELSDEGIQKVVFGDVLIERLPS